MNLTFNYLSEILRGVVDNNNDYQEALDIVRQNSSGKIWLIGGYVYRSLVKEIYRVGRGSKDFDFIIEEAKQKLILPRGFEIHLNHFGNPKFSGRFYSY